MKVNMHFWSYLAHFFLEWEMFQAKDVEKIKIPVSCSKIFFESDAVYEITWKNIVEPDRPQMTICCVCIACCIPKAIHTHIHREYVTLIAFPMQQCLQERASVLRDNAHWLYCYVLFSLLFAWFPFIWCCLNIFVYVNKKQSLKLHFF